MPIYTTITIISMSAVRELLLLGIYALILDQRLDSFYVSQQFTRHRHRRYQYLKKNSVFKSIIEIRADNVDLEKSLLKRAIFVRGNEV